MKGLARIGDVPSAAPLRRLRPCWRKVPHRSMGAALAHLKALRRNPLVRDAARLCAYECKCGAWHVGHVGGNG